MGNGMDPRLTIRDDVRPGDLGWTIARHGELYAAEYGWDATFEVLVAGIATAFYASHDPAREHVWFAEVDGHRVGCVYLVQASETVAKLRMLLVEPDARGLGVGRTLVATCLDFARAAGYETVTLWTNSVLVPARRLYESIGFVLVAAEPYHDFGHDLISETWDLNLADS